jgi:hypothetical protein
MNFTNKKGWTFQVLAELKGSKDGSITFSEKRRRCINCSVVNSVKKNVCSIFGSKSPQTWR